MSVSWSQFSCWESQCSYWCIFFFENPALRWLRRLSALPLRDKGYSYWCAPTIRVLVLKFSKSSNVGTGFNFRKPSARTGVHFRKPSARTGAFSKNPVLVLVCIFETQCSYWCAISKTQCSCWCAFSKPSARTGAFFEIQCSYWCIFQKPSARAGTSSNPVLVLVHLALVLVSGWLIKLALQVQSLY